MKTDRKASIIKESTRLFLSQGYHATSMDDICRAVGLQKGGIYHYFEGKEDILGECVKNSALEGLSILKQASDLDLPPMEKLRQVIHAQVQIVCDHPEIFIIFKENLDALDSKLQSEIKLIVASYEKIWDEVVAYGVESGQLRPDISPRLMSLVFLGICNWMFIWYRKEGGLSPSQIADQFFDMVTTGAARNNMRLQG
ncbi:MAG: TetR/AcrR family transcriptional regulator [Dehalococcoidia bacterium]|nr:TetR/AcrR family transcriptional regulator [Dehalococcoidia bacterium]